jgi:DNA-binding protein HU-beta
LPAAGRRALDAVLAALTEALREGHTVILTRFGTFDVRQMEARRVRAIRGPRMGQPVTVPAHRRAGFRPGAELARAVATPPPPPARRRRRAPSGDSRCRGRLSAAPVNPARRVLETRRAPGDANVAVVALGGLGDVARAPRTSPAWWRRSPCPRT